MESYVDQRYKEFLKNEGKADQVSPFLHVYNIKEKFNAFQANKKLQF